MYGKAGGKGGGHKLLSPRMLELLQEEVTSWICMASMMLQNTLEVNVCTLVCVYKYCAGSL